MIWVPIVVFAVIALTTGITAITAEETEMRFISMILFIATTISDIILITGEVLTDAL